MLDYTCARPVWYRAIIGPAAAAAHREVTADAVQPARDGPYVCTYELCRALRGIFFSRVLRGFKVLWARQSFLINGRLVLSLSLPGFVWHD